MGVVFQSSRRTGWATFAGSSVTVDVSANAAAKDAIAIGVTRAGPEHVIGLQIDAILETYPHDGAHDAEPNLFAHVDLSDADLPWRYSPASAPSTPWLALAVIPADKIAFEPIAAGTALSAGVVGQLPAFADAWAWAHVQSVSTGGGAIARLLCPRRLDPRTAYVACVVPTFAGTADAMIGTPSNRSAAASAWDGTSPVPVFYQWTFTTSAAGDFEALVRQLRPQPAPPRLGLLATTLEPPPLAAEVPIEIGGALVAPGTRPAAWTGADADAHRTWLAAHVDAGATTLAATDPVPEIGPPLYGAWAGNVAKVPHTTPKRWIDRINLEPALRAAAGVGADLVSQHQETLVAAAWDQLGAYEDRQRLLQRAQLADAIAGRMHDRHVASATSVGRILQLTSPAHRRTRADALGSDAPPTIDRPLQTLHSTLADTRSGPVVSTAFRRAVRPGSTLGRVAFAGAAEKTYEQINAGKAKLVPPQTLPATAITMKRIAGRKYDNAVEDTATSDAVAAARDYRLSSINAAIRANKPVRNGGGEPVLPGEDAGDPANRPSFKVAEFVKTFAAAAMDHQTYLLEALPLPPPEPPPPVAPIRDQLLTRLAPRRAIRKRLQAQVEATQVLASQGQLDPFRVRSAQPTFPEPVLPLLQDTRPELVAPGLDLLPAESVTLLETNIDFVAALMTGMNHALAIELAWRGFPVDRRTSFFRTFWGRTGIDHGARVYEPDLKPLSQWLHGTTHTASMASAALVLAIRGRIVARYPGLNVFVQNARWDGTERVPTADPVTTPWFSQRLRDDVLVVGFDLTPAQAMGKPDPSSGDAGVFFLIQQRVTGLRFGLDAADAAPPLQTWNDLAWPHVATTQPGYITLGAGDPLRGKTLPRSPRTATPLTWAGDSAALGAITMQAPVRLAIPGSVLLAPPST